MLIFFARPQKGFQFQSIYIVWFANFVGMLAFVSPIALCNINSNILPCSSPRAQAWRYQSGGRRRGFSDCELGLIHLCWYFLFAAQQNERFKANVCKVHCELSNN